MGATFDFLMMQKTAQASLDQAAAASVPPDDGAKIPKIAGYHAPPLHITGLPKSTEGGTGFSVDPEQVSGVSTAMTSDTNTLAKGLSQLNSDGPLAQIIGEDWETMNNLAANYGLAWDAISSFMQELHKTYQDTAAALRASANNYADADSASAAASDITS